MSFPASTILSEVVTVIQDKGGQRWPPVELLQWLNAGLREILTLKPTAFSKTRTISLIAGTKQTLDPEFSNLIRVVRNASGRAITTTDRETLDQIGINWHDTNIVPASPLVMHVCADSADPETFYVFPSNDGNGSIEAVVTIVHPDLAAPTPTEQLDLMNFTAQIDLDDVYRNALVDFVCYRAFSEDMLIDGKDARAMTHYKAFANALGARQQAELMANVNTTGQQPKGRGA